MSATNHYNMDLIPTGAVEWPALINANTNKVEAGRTVKLTAGEALAIRDPFYISSADGKAYKAANTNVCHGVWQSDTTGAEAEGYGQISGMMEGFLNMLLKLNSRMYQKNLAIPMQ